ncbi:paired amphipathic helix protein Sin3-like 5 [Lolium perenne]|uniref:paired amphipathic helix protein Sin3-like 5 n=1 Tax=Lolium perenne TaxID=4522 RepID=UPI0021F65312|nr:paired amphipathic helix protein Sin3-like 5 [Lolium perenne]
MVAPDEPDAESVGHRRGKKAYMVETMQCLMFARDNLPSDVYNEFVNTMIEIWKQCADPDGEIRSICSENCIKEAMKLFQDCAPVKRGFLDFTQGRSPIHFLESDDADVDINASIQIPFDLLQRAKICPDISDDNYKTMLQTLVEFYRKRTMTAREVFHIMKGCMSNCPALLEEFTNKFFPPEIQALLAHERNSKTGHVGKADLCFTPDANHTLDGIEIKVTNTRQEGIEESLFAEEDEEDNVKPLPDWITYRLEEKLPPQVNLTNCKPCTPSYYRLPHNCRTLQSSYRTKLGRSVLNDALVCGRSGSEESENSKLKAKNEYETEIFSCEVHMFESDVLLERFRSTADFIKNLQDHAGSPLNIKEHLSPLHMRCIERLYADDSDLDELLESQNTSAVLAVLLSRLNQKVEGLSDARLYLHRANSQVIAKNYYRSLDHRGPSFKHLDAKRMSQKALLAEAKEINRMRLNGADEYANPDVHRDISSVISSACASEVKQMMTWTKIVHPFLSAQYMCPSLGETVAPEKACEYCGTNKDFLALPAKLPLSSKRDESPRKKSNECSYSQDGFGGDIEEGEFVPDTKIIKCDVMLGPRKRPESHGVGASSGDEPGPTTHDHMNEPENQYESRQQFKRIAKPRGMKGGTCCSLVVLRRLYQIFYERLRTARDLCTDDLYAEFKEKLVRLLDRSIDNYKFEDFCLKFLGPKSFKLFTLDIVINRVIKQICIISSSDQDNLLVQFLENLRRPTSPKILSQHQNFPSNPSDGSPKHAGEERDKALDDTGKLKPRHFERRKKRKLESDGVSSPRLGEGFQTHSGR